MGTWNRTVAPLVELYLYIRYDKEMKLLEVVQVTTLALDCSCLKNLLKTAMYL